MADGLLKQTINIVRFRNQLYWTPAAKLLLQSCKSSYLDKINSSLVSDQVLPGSGETDGPQGRAQVTLRVVL
jgi:hypothetical protein